MKIPCCKLAVRKCGAELRTRNPRPAKAGEVEQFAKIGQRKMVSHNTISKDKEINVLHMMLLTV
jgi:hypothetical protein